MQDVKALVRIPMDFAQGGRSVVDLFEAAAPDLGDIKDLRTRIHDELAADPQLLEAWQTYSYDKRGTPSPYLDGLEVGFFDRSRQDVVSYDNSVDACSDYICREAESVLQPGPRSS